MTMNPLPPQAYTKETLVKAYAWVQSQSEGIKEIATTPDVLVSLYLKAKLQGESALDRPSIQNFKNELKNLAGMMGEFEVVEPTPSVGNSSSNQNYGQLGQTVRLRSQDFRNENRQENRQDNKPENKPVYRQENRQEMKQENRPETSNASAVLEGLDFRSICMIQEVKNQFNLSSETEALRLLIAIGHSQAKSIVKS